MSIVKHPMSSLMLTVDVIKRSRAETTIDGKYQFSIGALTYRSAVVQGTVISKRSFPKFDLIIVDDGTGVIPCIKWGSLSYVGLGDLVRVIGSLTIYENEVQISIHRRVYIVPTADEEVEWLRQLCDIWQVVYQAPLTHSMSI
mmetsp:Transcript_29581/g.52826  ORF Transcript_29581/g.52826 Transcript_29581/m.52826 type:complete len:143 (+) Transcript_29581:108-536(+)